MKNGGLRTGKRKHGVPEDMRGQSGQEGVGRDEAVTRATKGTDTKVGVTARSTAKEHDEHGENEKRMMGSSKDQSTSTHSKERIRRIHEADKGRETGSVMAFGRTDRGRKCGHQKWRSGCSRWFEDTQWTWRIRWRQRLGEHR